jgi:PAS domain S-box-containing protein
MLNLDGLRAKALVGAALPPSLADAILEVLPAAVYVCDAAGVVVRYNRKAAELWARQPVPGDPAELYCGSCKIFMPDGRFVPHDECPMAEALRTGEPQRNIEAQFEQPNGNRVFVLVNIEPIKDDAGQVLGAINCFQDITARKRAEEELSRKTREIEDFFENGAIGLHIVSGEGIILRANKAELNFLGYTAEEYVGHHITEFHADAPVIGDILERLSCGQKLDRYPRGSRRRTARSSMSSSRRAAVSLTASSSIRAASRWMRRNCTNREARVA